jgi:hypothetical protein
MQNGNSLLSHEARDGKWSLVKIAHYETVRLRAKIPPRDLDVVRESQRAPHTSIDGDDWAKVRSVERTNDGSNY